MADATNTVASTAAKKAVVNRAAEAAAVSAAEISSVMPTVVETAELAMHVPAKVVLNQKLIVGASIVGGAALGAGIFYGVQKFRERRFKAQMVKVAENMTAGEPPTTTA